MWALGHNLDVCSGIAPVADLAAGANTGHRLHLKNYEGAVVVFMKNTASAGTDDIVITLQEHNAATSGTSANLAVITEYYYKREASLDGDEAWVQVTQSAGATITLAGATYATLQAVVAFHVEAPQLSDDYEWVSVNIADPGSGGTIPGVYFYIPYGLKRRRLPSLLAQPNA